MAISSVQIENKGNVVRINNGSGYNNYNFYKLQYVKSAIVQGTTSIPNTSPTVADAKAANDSLDTNISSYCTTYHAYSSNWLSTPSYICYEVNRDIMNAAGANVSRLHAQVDIYQIVQESGNNAM